MKLYKTSDWELVLYLVAHLAALSAWPLTFFALSLRELAGDRLFRAPQIVRQ